MREGLTSAMPEIRRYWLQSIYLVSENISRTNKLEPYEFIINELVDSLTDLPDSKLLRQSEELYELLADACLHLYDQQRELKKQNIEFEHS